MNALIVFGRSPGDPTGKSRLRTLVGPELVDTLYGAFVADILSWELPAATILIAALSAPADGLRLLAPDARFLVQPALGFGARIRAAFDSAFHLGAERVVIVGTDAPTLPAESLAACFAGLDGHRSTLIPAVDGGWVALGLDAPLGNDLDRVPWSSRRTCAATQALLRRAGRSPALLDPWYDVDDADGLERLRAEVVGTGSLRAPRTAAALVALQP